MTAIIYEFPIAADAFPQTTELPEDDLVLAARQVCDDADDASMNALANAACCLRSRGNDTTDQVRATKAERIVIARYAALRAAEAPVAWVQDEPPARPWHVVFMLAAVIVAGVAFAAWAEGVMTDAAAAALAEQGGW